MSNIQIVVPEGTTTENFATAYAEGKVTFYTVRANDTRRRVQVPVEGTDARKVGDWLLEQRDAGRTMKDIAAEMHLSVPSVRRMINATLLAIEVEEYDEEELAELLAFEDEPEASTEATAEQAASTEQDATAEATSAV